MKRYFYILMGVFVTAAVLLVCYGGFMNYRSEKNISRMLSQNKLTLEGTYAQYKMVSGHFMNANVRLEAEKSADVVSRSTGMLEQVFVFEGEKVKKGQPLALVASEEVAMNIAQVEANLSKARTSVNRFRVSYERYAQLLDKNAISQEKFDEVKAEYLSAQDEVKALQAQKEKYELEKDRLTIESPMDGTVIIIYKKPGSFLSMGTPIALVGDFSNYLYKEEWADNRIDALLPLYQTWKLKFNRNDLQRLYDDNFKPGNKGYDEVFKAKIVRILPPLAVSADMRTIYWQIENTSEMLEPRTYQNVVFNAGDEHYGLIVPRSAVKKNNSVFVWGQDKKLEERPVVTGLETEGGIEILGGLMDGEVVIISDTTGVTAGSEADVHIKDET